MDHVVDGQGGEALGERHLRDVHVVEAEGSLAAFAIEVWMMVFRRTLVLAAAQLIEQRSATVLDAVDDVAVEKERECTEDGAAVGRHHTFFQFAQRERPACPFQFVIDQEPHGGGFDTVRGEGGFTTKSLTPDPSPGKSLTPGPSPRRGEIILGALYLRHSIFYFIFSSVRLPVLSLSSPLSSERGRG